MNHLLLKKSGNFIKAKALELIAKDQVSLNIKLKCFTVSSNNNHYVVTLLPPQPKCTCPSPIICSHIIAAILTIGHEPSDDILNDVSKVINLTKLRKNARGTKKSGRKKPRQGDYNIRDEDKEDGVVPPKKKKIMLFAMTKKTMTVCIFLLYFSPIACYYSPNFLYISRTFLLFSCLVM